MFQTDKAIHSSPVVCNNMVYFGCDNGNIYVVFSETGKMLNSFKTAYKIRSSAVLNKGKLYVVGAQLHCFNKLQKKSHIPFNATLFLSLLMCKKNYDVFILFKKDFFFLPLCSSSSE